ncbi:MAG: hypothetical protein ACRD9W_19530, partial [Terriglobia bacterium]
MKTVGARKTGSKRTPPLHALAFGSVAGFLWCTFSSAALLKCDRAGILENGHMISHQYKCIFIHPQSCGGTSIEAWICGQDWWAVEPATKHFLASQARKLYAQWWDEYFKFSIVREPVDRMISCLRFPPHFGLVLTAANRMLLDGYHQLYGRDIVLENDYRFSKREDLLSAKHKP